MKSVYILAILLIAVFILGTYQSYSLNTLYPQDQQYPTALPTQPIQQEIAYAKMPANPGQLKATSQPAGNAYQNSQCDTVAPIPKSSVYLYEDDTNVSNKGFVNELIYKPQTNDTLPYAPVNIIDKPLQLNPPVCVLSTDLPIANINVNYFLDKNTTKLRT